MIDDYDLLCVCETGVKMLLPVAMLMLSLTQIFITFISLLSVEAEIAAVRHTQAITHITIDIYSFVEMYTF